MRSNLKPHRPNRRGGDVSAEPGVPSTIIPLGADKGALRLTSARYFTPSGRSIQAKGIEPDIKVLQEVPADLKARNNAEGEASPPHGGARAANSLRKLLRRGSLA